MSEERSFPVMVGYYERLQDPIFKDCPRFVKWSELDNDWAIKIHSQSLKRLAERGGLCPEEIVLNVNKLEYTTKVDKKFAVEFVKQIAFVAPQDKP